MIGITIGCGGYHDMAQRAAATMALRTGLKCIVLGDEHLRLAGMSNWPPAWLKLAIWEFVGDEDVLLFDADTCCIQPWSPSEFVASNALIATRDWNWRKYVQDEAASIHIRPEDYFLSSVLILNRTAHEPMLRLAKQLRHTVSDRLYEQTALNAARHQLGLPLRFLDRRYNWSLYGEGNLWRQGGAIVAHFNSPSLRSKWRELESVADSTAVSTGDFEVYGDKFYRYSRIGHDERAMLLRADGTIGAGGGDAERFWFMKRGEPDRLVIASETDVTCELRLDSRDIWRGKWESYERMPIELMVHRGQVLIDLLGDVARGWTGVELGIFEGNTSQLLLRELPNLMLWMVDRWRSPLPGERYWEDPYIREVSQTQMGQAMLRALEITEFAANRRFVLVCDQVRAAECVDDESLDFVFVDSDHSKAGTIEAIDTWWPKLRLGGLMAGHDLDYPGFPGVREAVEHATTRRQLPWFSASDYFWYFRRS